MREASTGSGPRYGPAGVPPDGGRSLDRPIGRDYVQGDRFVDLLFREGKEVETDLPRLQGARQHVAPAEWWSIYARDDAEAAALRLYDNVAAVQSRDRNHMGIISRVYRSAEQATTGSSRCACREHEKARKPHRQMWRSAW